MPSSERIRATTKTRDIASSVTKLANLKEITSYLE
jgi:hypothetical protein